MRAALRLTIGLLAAISASLSDGIDTYAEEAINTGDLASVNATPANYGLSGGCENAFDACGCDDCSGCGNGCLTGGIFGPCGLTGQHRACYDHDQRHGLADKHAPAGLMGDHVHKPGEWMVEYKYMNMYMDGNRAGTRNVPLAQTFGFDGTNMAATPTSMTMEMHMIHIMYGWKENVTLYAMPMLSSLTMDHLRRANGTKFTINNSGFADLRMGALWRLYEGCNDELILNIGFSVPTGNIDRTTTIPTNGAMVQELPYPMRLGTGTFNARPGITYKRYFDWGSFGMQYQAHLPVGHNWDNYAVSKRHRFNAWATWLPCDRLALSYRVEGLIRSNFTGADPGLNPALISTARPDMRGGNWVNFGYGASLLVGNGYLLSFEAVHPVYQYLKGIQLAQNLTIFASVSKAF